MSQIRFDEEQSTIQKTDYKAVPTGLTGLILRTPFIKTKSQANLALIIIFIVCSITIILINFPKQSSPTNLPPEAYADQILNE